MSSGQPLSLRNFGDSPTETAYKTTKIGPICYDGGKKERSTGKSSVRKFGDNLDSKNR